jgi:hypothetical protein
MAMSVYAAPNFAKGARVSLRCSTKRLFAHACFAPSSIALAPGHVAALYSSEDFAGERAVLASSAANLAWLSSARVVRSVLVCRGGAEEACVPGSQAALPLCEEETAGDALAKEASLSKTDAARFGYLGKGIKARKFRALASRGLLLKSMGAELRQEACFYKEVIQDIARGCGPDDAALRALVTEGHVVKFSGVALMKRGTCEDGGGGGGGGGGEGEGGEGGGGGGEGGGGEGEGGGSGASAAAVTAAAPPQQKRLEFLALEDMLHGLTNSSLIDIDVSGQPNAVCRLCSVDVKNFKTWNYAKGERVAGDRVWWKRETRCVSKQVSSGLDKLLSAGGVKGEGSLTSRDAVLDALLPKMERAKQLLLEQKEVDFTDGSFLIAFGVDAASGELVVRLRVIDFGHANWKSQAAPRLSEVVGGKQWFKNPGKLTPGKFGCGASELLARLKALRGDKPLPSACVAKCLSACRSGQKYQCKVYNHADEKPIVDEAENKKKVCARELVPVVGGGGAGTTAGAETLAAAAGAAAEEEEKGEEEKGEAEDETRREVLRKVLRNVPKKGSGSGAKKGSGSGAAKRKANVEEEVEEAVEEEEA